MSVESGNFLSRKELIASWVTAEFPESEKKSLGFEMSLMTASISGCTVPSRPYLLNQLALPEITRKFPALFYCYLQIPNIFPFLIVFLVKLRPDLYRFISTQLWSKKMFMVYKIHLLKLKLSFILTYILCEMLVAMSRIIGHL